MTPKEKIRNIAIIAHIDHGKTTLLDALLKFTETFKEHEQVPDRIMDSDAQEKERGITILAKHTGVFYKDYKINIIDTPGHADFSGEVERILGMVNSVLLLVDAREGPMPQTRFVLKKALEKGLKPIVIINKIDRPHSDPDRVLDEVFDLFIELGATDEQADFSYCYASAIKEYAMLKIDDEPKDLAPIFEMIIKHVMVPQGESDAPFLMQCATLHYDKYLGRLATGQILNGSVKQNDDVIYVNNKGEEKRGRITRIQTYHGILKQDMEEASSGDIVCLAGIEDVLVGDAICSPKKIVHMDPINIDEPTVSIDFMVNSSPFSGQDGKYLTMNRIKDRLQEEKKANISLKITLDPSNQDKVTVAGRGELHLSVLIENMRREGFEMSISKPKVVIKEIDGEKCEPLERAYIEVPEDCSGTIIEELSRRKGEMQSLQTDEHGNTQLEFLIPTRGLMGWRGNFLTKTRGKGILTSIFHSFVPWKGEIAHRSNGVLVSINQGKSNAYACYNLQSRGTLFLGATEDVYEGMIVGENTRANDLVVNVTKGKQLTNVRASGTDEMIQLTPPKKLTLEQCIDYLNDDELLEITPNNLRLRKIHLKENDRKRNR
ncbi:MAG: GTP-binding protein TypA/BipA [Chlamydiae bacterium]|nr:GTP-binding protein TypA/BipA [Chlamydiota bacterium]